MQTENPVLEQAAMDYSPATAWVNSVAIRESRCPEMLGRSGSVLEGTPLHRQPLLFTAFIVAMNVLNYRFWDVPAEEIPKGLRRAPAQIHRYHHNGRTGSTAMQAAFYAWWARNMPPMSDARECLRLTVENMREELTTLGVAPIFGAIPEAAGRLLLLKEVLNGPRLLSVATGLLARVQEERQLGWPDAQWLAALFPESYQDLYLKKAQLTLMLLAAEWRECGTEVSLDVTAAADYQLPKMLRALGFIGYSTYLSTRVDGGYLVDEDTDAERAIRAATVMAVEDLAKHWQVTVEDIDHWLWAHRETASDARFHLTPTTRY